MPEYLAPGVYVEEVSFRAPSIEGVGTTTTGFAGPTLTGPVSGTPELLTSFGDFMNIYGGYDDLSLVASGDIRNRNYMALAVKSFFDNGGSMLYVSRVFAAKGGGDTGIAKGGTFADSDVGVTAQFPGAFGNHTVTVGLVAAKTQTTSGLPPGTVLALAPTGGGAITYYTNGAGSTFQSGGTALPSPPGGTLYILTVTVTVNGAGGQPLVYEGLGLDANHPNYIGLVLGPVPPRHIDQLQNQVSFTIGKSLTATTLFSALFGTWSGPPAAATKTFTLTGGDDGGEPASTDYDNALKGFEALEDIAIVAAPGSSAFTQHQAIANSLITHVSRQRAYRIAVLDSPPNQIASDNEDVRSVIDSSYAALYVPWVIMPNPLARTGTATPAEIAVPPSGAVCGIYARNDHEHNVSKAPANEVVLGALALERNITFAEQGLLNPLGINCIRSFPDRGIRVWGARTASSDSEFKYVNVRRYMIYLEHSIDNSTQWAVFENNGPQLWARVKDSVESFLNNEFKENRLLGTSPAEAYFVRCDRTTMTQNDLDNGRMICLIGVAVLKPAEFVIFRIGQKTADARS